MAEQAGIRAFHLAEARGHFGVGDVIDLVRARPKKNAIHDGRHVAGHAAAGLGSSRVMRMGARIACEFAVALQAHAIRIVWEFQRSRIHGGVRRVRLMTVSAMRLPLAEAGRASKCFHDERRFTKPAVFIESSSRDIAERLAQLRREERG